VRYFETKFLEEADQFIAGLDLKKGDKVPENEITRAENIRKKYFDSKPKK